MSIAGFERCLAIAWQPDNDGQDKVYSTPGDAGGSTRMGVIFSNFVAWRHAHSRPTPTLEDFQNASKAELEDIIHAWFWMPAAGDTMAVGLDLIAFEVAFGSGTGWAARLLQRTLGRPESFTLRNADVQAANAVSDRRGLIQHFSAVHLTFVEALAGAHRFGKGWERRIRGDEAAALSWVN